MTTRGMLTKWETFTLREHLYIQVDNHVAAQLLLLGSYMSYPM